MTDRELLDHFSDLLISDPRLLSLQERELLSNLLQHTLHTNEDSAVTKSIARAVGETVAERMHEALGTSILQRLAAERLRSTSNSTGFAPRPPSPGPPSPGVSCDLAETSAQSFAPRPPSPGPPSPGVSRDLAARHGRRLDDALAERGQDLSGDADQSGWGEHDEADEQQAEIE